MTKKRIELFWTGGWDSTFMLLKLARENEGTIQPYYLDVERPGRKEEHQAMRLITAALKDVRNLKGKILPVKIVSPKFFSPSEEVIRAWLKYRDVPYKLGGQYRYIAEFAKQHKGISCGLEQYLETPGHVRLLTEKGGLYFNKELIGRLDKKKADPDVFLLFGNMTYPVAKYSEQKMLDIVREWGYEDVVKHIHFCYYPISGKPCGMCGPCQFKLRHKMEFLFSKEALACGKVMQMLERLPRQENTGMFDLPELFMMYKNPCYRRNKIIGGDGYVSSLLSEMLGVYRAYFDRLMDAGSKNFS